MTGWQSIDAAVQCLGLKMGAPTTGQTTGGGHVTDSEHYQGRARDFGSADSDPAAIAQALLPYAQGPGAPIDELFYSPLGIFYKNGSAISPDPSLLQEHYDHVHVGVGSTVDLGSLVCSGAGTTAQLVSSIPGAGIVGDALSSIVDPLRKSLLTAVFLAGGLGLVVLGGLRFVRRGEP
jgi:hypothetical protein